MCRFLLAQSSQTLPAQALLAKFSQMCEQSKCLDGDDQGDGWGLAYLDQQNNWQTNKFLEPIWQNSSQIKIPPTRQLVLHARSATFAHHKDLLEFNQPFSDGERVFVFNGLVRGVKFARPIPGQIGSQKIWSLLQAHLDSQANPQTALEKTVQEIQNHTREIVALNLGLATKDRFWAYCQYKPQPTDYYQLYQWTDDTTHLVCSEPLLDYQFQLLVQKQVI
jgi:predicted glutamine amidotransferase